MVYKYLQIQPETQTKIAALPAGITPRRLAGGLGLGAAVGFGGMHLYDRFSRPQPSSFFNPERLGSVRGSIHGFADTARNLLDLHGDFRNFQTQQALSAHQHQLQLQQLYSGGGSPQAKQEAFQRAQQQHRARAAQQAQQFPHR